MSRATACFSMYSDMSMRTMACSSSKRNSASARAVSVFPTPVGPRHIPAPIGRFASRRPARQRLLGPLHLLRKLWKEAVGNLGCLLQIPTARGLFGCDPRLLDLLLDFSD